MSEGGDVTEQKRETMGGFSELARSRRSVRRYRPDPVPTELVEQVLEAGRWAPSALNLQPWHFIVVSSDEVRRAVYNATGAGGLKWKHILQAPVLIVVCSNPLHRWARDDAIFAAQNMMLQAADSDLGTCWIGGYNEERLRAVLRIPDGWHVPGFMTLGYPEHVGNPPGRREMTEMVSEETFAGRGLSFKQVGPFMRLLLKLLRLQHAPKPRDRDEHDEK